MLLVIFETKTGLTVLSGCQDELGCLEEGRRLDPLDRQKQCVQHVCVISSHDITAVRIHSSRTARTRTLVHMYTSTSTNAMHPPL